MFYLILPSGFYLNKFSSETWSIFFTLLSIYFHEEKIGNNLNQFFIGICLYFFLLIKLTNIFLALSLILLFYLKSLNRKKKNYVQNFIPFLQTIFLIFLAIILVSIYHKLLTGNHFQSFYSYGDKNFQSFDYKNLKLFEVIFSSWHGLLFYHPIYLFINIFLPLMLFFKKKINIILKGIIIINLLLFLSQLFLQSSHFFWWMGTDTFGARGFSGIAIITFYVFLNINKSLKLLKINKSFVFFSIIILIWHTYLLSMGETNFVNYEVFLNKFLSSYTSIFFLKILLIFFLIYFFTKKRRFNFLEIFQSVTIGLVFFILIDNFFSYFKNNSNFMILLLLLVSLTFLLRINNNYLKYLYKLKNFSILFFILIFFNSLYFQYNLFSQYKSIKNTNYIGGKSINCKYVMRSLYEYNFINGYDEDKLILKNFIKKKCPEFN